MKTLSKRNLDNQLPHLCRPKTTRNLLIILCTILMNFGIVESIANRFSISNGNKVFFTLVFEFNENKKDFATQEMRKK